MNTEEKIKLNEEEITKLSNKIDKNMVGKKEAQQQQFELKDQIRKLENFLIANEPVLKNLNNEKVKLQTKTSQLISNLTKERKEAEKLRNEID